MSVLKRSFFERPTLEVAQELIGKVLVFGNKKAVITETEAYFGDDPASHGVNGKINRNFPVFGPAGHTYVYFIYGMYHCLNIIIEKEGYPAVVLIRGIEGFNGPGKLCKALGITRDQNDIDLCTSKTLFI